MKGILLNVSGGAIKFIALIVAFMTLIGLNIPVVALSGVSSGAIIVFLFCCGRLKEGLSMARKSHDIKTIFSKRNQPTGKIGGFSFSAILKIISGKNYIGIMDQLEKNIREIVSSEDFQKYLDNPESPDCYILGVEKDTGAHLIINLKDVSYNEAIDIVIGSSSIAPTIKFRKFRGELIADGGHRGHSAGAYLLNTDHEDIKSRISKCITIYSRPEPEIYSAETLGQMNNFFLRMVNFVIGLFIKETSLNDEYMEQQECSGSGIEYCPVYIDRFTKSTYHIEKHEIARGETIGKNSVSEYYLLKGQTKQYTSTEVPLFFMADSRLEAHKKIELECKFINIDPPPLDSVRVVGLE